MDDKKELKTMTPAQRRKYNDIQVIEGKMDLGSMSLNDLAMAYTQVDGRIQLVKGKILLEARKRYASDAEFGYWVEENIPDAPTQQTRWNYMQLAEFYSHRDTTGMSPTVCIEIAKFASKVKEHNKSWAIKAHEWAHGRNVSKKQIQEYLAGLEKEIYYIPKRKASRVVHTLESYSNPVEVTEGIAPSPILKEKVEATETTSVVKQIATVYQEAENIAREYEDDVLFIMEVLKDKPLKIQDAIIQTCAMRVMQSLTGIV